MKKEYIKPIVTETISLGEEIMFEYQSYDHADTKEPLIEIEDDFEDEEDIDNKVIWKTGW